MFRLLPGVLPLWIMSVCSVNHTVTCRALFISRGGCIKRIFSPSLSVAAQISYGKLSLLFVPNFCREILARHALNVLFSQTVAGQYSHCTLKVFFASRMLQGNTRTAHGTLKVFLPPKCCRIILARHTKCVFCLPNVAG